MKRLNGMSGGKRALDEKEDNGLQFNELEYEGNARRSWRDGVDEATFI